MSVTALQAAGDKFCKLSPHRQAPFNKRNWGGTLHSLCSYQGKLKPSIAHFLIRAFTQPGDRVLDPLAGVGTIPLEARRQQRIGLASDLSPLAAAVSRSKLEPFSGEDVWSRFLELRAAMATPVDVRLEEAEFGLNGAIRDYFHHATLKEILAARSWFQKKRSNNGWSTPDAVILTSLLHILHGNRPYALSRTSHPVTPFAPSGPAVYKNVAHHLETRLQKVVPALLEISDEHLPPSSALEMDFRDLPGAIQPVDAVITSPPFSSSLRFWSSNWMRLWLAGWSAEDFKVEPKRFLEAEQRRTYEPYAHFAKAMYGCLRSEGTLILHLGETATDNMINGVKPQLEPFFSVEYIGRECVKSTESHGLRDKGATIAHWYLFARRRGSIASRGRHQPF